MNAQAVPTDRDLQDEIIRYLTGASSEPAAVLNSTEAERAQRFSRFLARRYYRDRLQRAFRYSRTFAILQSSTVETGHPSSLPDDHPASITSAEQIVDSGEFDKFLVDCVLGSLASAREVGEMAVSRLLQVSAPGPWWPELLRYEFGFFVQLATSEIEAPSEVGLPQVAKSTLCREFSWRMPPLLASLKSGRISDDDLRGRALLLFSRTHHGKIYVVELDAAAAGVLSATNGRRKVAEIAAAAAISEVQTQRILASLAEVGAVLLADPE